MGKGRGKRDIKVKFNKRGLILCEGETEENYFKGLISQEKHRRRFASINVEIFKPKDHSPIGLIKHAKKLIKQAKQDQNDYDFVWVVFDKDGHHRIPDAFEMARTNKPVIKVALTSPCFEFFILLHFEKTSRPFTKCDDVISYIKKAGYIPEYKKASNLFKMLERVKEVGLVNSKWLRKQNESDIQNGVREYQLPVFIGVDSLIDCLYELL
ncbi:MAG: RloB family protein [Cytophagales bacterium]|nr:RloB family protein [Cytophagales bacterium]